MAQQLLPYYTQPHVWAKINDNTQYAEEVAIPDSAVQKPYSTACVSGADRGIDNAFVRIPGLSTYRNLFGKSNYTKYGQASLQTETILRTNQCNVWFMRVLPDDARYANIIVLAKYRISDSIDKNGNITGLKQLDIKYDITSAAPPDVPDGALREEDIYNYAAKFINNTSDPLTGYRTLPLFFIRSIGRGNYGNKYAIRLQRDTESEFDYGVKTYGFGLIDNDVSTRTVNYYTGSLTNITRNNTSLLIDDVLGQFELGFAPIQIRSFEDTMITLYDEYQRVINENEAYLNSTGITNEASNVLNIAKSITIEVFDPIFGLLINTRSNEQMPYFKAYSQSTVPYVKPDKTVSNQKPATKASWYNAFIGARLLVTNDPDHSNLRWSYNVINIDSQDNIYYDEGIEEAIDAAEYNGAKLDLDVGHMLKGGFDGQFESVSVQGNTRAPNNAELKILLAKEYVKAFRGYKDRRILSPSAMNLDFVFDANYNMSIGDIDFRVDNVIRSLYVNNSMLMDDDYRRLVITAAGTPPNILVNTDDINVKKAMYDMIESRNKDGMILDTNRGAGTHLYLDCGLVGSKTMTVNSELLDTITAMEYFYGWNTSIDFGYYEIVDPNTSKKVKVTATYLLAEKLIPHIVRYGMNEPFVNNFATVTNMVRGSFYPVLDLIDWDVNEALYKNRINYYMTVDEGSTVQRATQSTRQLDASALLEENNMRVLDALYKGLKKACRGYLYKWNDSTVRKGYTDTQMDIYQPWIGKYVQDLDIRFEANEYEQRHMLLHLYADVAFPDIAKRIIMEVNINRPVYTA